MGSYAFQTVSNRSSHSIFFSSRLPGIVTQTAVAAYFRGKACPRKFVQDCLSGSVFPVPYLFFHICIYFFRSAFIFPDPQSFFQIRIHFSRSAFMFPDPHFLFLGPHSFFQIRMHFCRSAIICPDPHLFFQISVQPETWLGFRIPRLNFLRIIFPPSDE